MPDVLAYALERYLAEHPDAGQGYTSVRAFAEHLAREFNVGRHKWYAALTAHGWKPARATDKFATLPERTGIPTAGHDTRDSRTAEDDAQQPGTEKTFDARSYGHASIEAPVQEVEGQKASSEEPTATNCSHETRDARFHETDKTTVSNSLAQEDSRPDSRARRAEYEARKREQERAEFEELTSFLDEVEGGHRESRSSSPGERASAS